MEITIRWVAFPEGKGCGGVKVSSYTVDKKVQSIRYPKEGHPIDKSHKNSDISFVKLPFFTCQSVGRE
jgi:hypothetical protein